MDLAVDLNIIIAQQPILAACSEQTLTAIRRVARLRAFDAGAVLYREGEPAQVALFPLSGALQISKAGRGRRCQVLCNMSTDSCGGLCLLTLTDKSLADVSGLAPGYIFALDRMTFQNLSRADPALCHSAWNAVLGCMSHLSNLVETLSFNKVARRVALMLVEHSAQDGDLVRRTQAQIAAEVGTTREVVARALADLQEAGAVRLGRGRIAVLDRAKLSQET